MKKCGLFAILFGMAVMSFILFSSCDIGLGEAVDTEPPSMTIENPQPSVIIRDAFQICGTFTDDGTISALKIELTDNQTQKKYGPIDGTWDEEHNWQATINPLDLHIPDGKYEATITMSDNGGHSSVSTRSFVIDNTAPVVVLSRPASDASETDSNKIESYGQYLTIEGQAADDNNIEKIVINFFDEAGVEIPAAKKEITSIPPTISLDVAKFLDNGVYSALYGNDKSQGEKRFTCTITAYDTAKRYPPKGKEEADDNYGNGESSYILWTDWEKFQTEYQKATNSTSKIKVPDLYSIKSGKAATTNERSAETDSLIVNFFEKTVSRASFKLNPLNNPSYSISGLDLGVVSEVENERSLTIQLAKGLDGLSLDTENMKVYLIPLDENGNEVSNTKLYPQKSEFQLKGDGQFLTAIQKDNVKDAEGNATNLVYGTKYVIGVEGTDSEGNSIVPSFDGSKFLIRFKAKSVAPRLTVDSPSEPTTYIKKGKALLFKGTTAVPDGYPTISITCKKGEEDSATVYTYKVTEADKKGIEDGYIYYNWAFTVPAAGTEGQFCFDQTKSSIYEFDIAADLENMPNNRSKTVFYDVENPTIKIDSMLPTAEKYTGAEDGTKLEGSYLNGDVTMQVAISDDDAVNKEIKDQNDDKRPYFIIQDANTGDDISFRVGTETEPTKKHYITIPQKQSFVIHTEDIASTVQARKIKVKIFAQDRAGNFAVDFDDRTKNYFEREYTVDQSTDIPVILPYNSGSLTLTYSTKEELENHLAAKEYKSVLTTGSDLLLNLKDDDGIQKVLFYIGSKDTALAENATPVINQTPQGSPSATTLQYTLPTISGRYECKIQVEDTVGKKAEKAFWIIVTGAAPQVSISSTTPDNKIITLSTGAKTTDAKDQFVNNISIESGYTEFTVKRIEKINGEDVETVLYGPDEANGTLKKKNFKDTFIPAANRSENKIKYEVIDEMNHSGEREFVYYTDNAAPVIKGSITVPNNTQTASWSANFVAEFNDPEEKNSEGNTKEGTKKSGISRLEYVFETGVAASEPSASALTHIKEENGVSSLNKDIIFNADEYNYVFGTEGTKTIYIRAIDNVGNIGPWAAKSFMFDKASPVVSIDEYKRDEVDEGFNPLTSTNKRFQSGKEFSLKGTASDATGLSSFEIWQNDIKLNISKANVDENGNWIITGLPKNAAGATVVESGVYTYKVIATDNSAFGTGENAQNAKTTTQTIEVTIDVTDPRVKIGLVSDDSLESTVTDFESTNYGVSSISGSAPFTFTGKADDNESDENEAIRNSASLVRELFYAFTKTAENPPADLEFVSYGNPSGGNWNIPMNLGIGKNDGQEIVKGGDDGKTPVTLYEGQKYLWVYVYDEAGNMSLVKHVGFMVDQAAPSIIETNVHKLTGTDANITESQSAETPKADGIVYLNKDSAATGYTLKGKVSDVNGISRVTVDGNDVNELTLISATEGTYSWKWTNSNQQGDYTHEVVVYDKSGKNGADGKSNSTTIHVIFDTTDPTADIEDFDETNTTKQKWLKGTGSSIINGTAAEVGNGSGLASIYYKVDKGVNDYPAENSLNGWKKLPTSTSWTDAYNPSSLSENTNTDDSSHTITVLVYDKAGNKCEKIRYFRYDKSNPTITFSGSANPGVNSKRNTGFTLTVNAKDTNEVADVKFIYGNNEVSVTTPDSGDKKDGVYSKSFTVGQNTNALEDGTYDFTIRVFDIAGNYADETRSFTIDTQKPSIETVKINNNDEVTKGTNPSGWYNTQAIPLTVTPRDNEGGSGVYTVEYQTLKDTESELDESKWIPLPSPTTDYSGSAIFNGVGIGQKLYIRVKDEAGNIEYFNSNNDSVLLNIDTTVPTVGNTFYYKLEGETTATQSTGQIYVNGSKDLIIYGPASDSESGLASVSFKIGENPVTPSSIEYAVTGTDETMAAQTYSASPSDTKDIKYWKATFNKTYIDSKDKCGTLKVTATNGAVGADGTGASSPEATVLNITYDNTKPVPVINSFISTNTKKQPYKKSETEYYVNNKDGTPTFTISGIASDNCGVKDVTLTIGGTPVPRDSSSSLNEWSFSNIDLKNYGETATPTATLTVTDVAGNTDYKEVNLNFDVTGPKAKHWADSNNKDIYFRIGSGVGGKYAYGTYGKDSSMEIRGTFEELGSGLKAVYYKLYDSEPTDISGFVNGTDSADGNIAVVTESEIAVPYNSDSATINVASNFHGQIQVFSNTQTNRYLVLVAEDNAGNRAADTLAIYGGPENAASNAKWNCDAPNATDSTNKNYYSLNKDTTPPTVRGKITQGAYTDGTGNLVVSGTVSDNASGVKSVTVRIDDGVEYPATVSNGTWTSSIAISNFVTANTQSGTFTVYVTATDNAGEGNSKQISAGTITVDTEDPKFENIRFTETESSTTKDVYTTKDSADSTIYYVKNDSTTKTFKISGLATDNFGVESVKLDVVDTTANSTTEPLSETKTDDDVKGTCEFTIGNWKSWTTNNARATITVTDKAGNHITKDLTIVFDRTEPSVNKSKLTLPDEYQTEGKLFKFEGTSDSVTDATSGPDKLDIAFTSAPETGDPEAPESAMVSGIEVSSDGSWSSTVEFTKEPFNTEGEKYLWVKAYDKTGNESVWKNSDKFIYDTAIPTLSFEDTETEKNPSEDSYNKANFTFRLEAKDNYGVDKVEILYKTSKEGDDKTEPATRESGDEKNGIWKKTFTVGTDSLTDGRYDFTIKVTDKAEKTYTVHRKLTVDSTPPTAVFEPDSYEPKAKTGTSWYNSSSIKFAVNVTDENISTVKISKDNKNFESMSASASSNTFTGTITGLKEGLNNIYLNMEDKAGNSNSFTTTVNVDSTAPATLTAYDSDGNVISGSLLTNQKLPKDVYIAVEDDCIRGKKITAETAPSDWTTNYANYYTDEDLTTPVSSNTTYVANTYYEKDISSVTGIAFVKYGSTEVTSPETSGTNSGRYKITIPAASQSGNINVTVKDKAGNEARLLAFRFESDIKEPVVAISTPSSSTVYGTKDITGTVTEINPKSVSLYYRTSAPTASTAPDATDSGWTLIKKITKDSGTDTTKVKYNATDSEIYSWKVSDVNFNTLSGVSATADSYTKPIYFLVYAEDKAGNKSVISTPYYTKNYTVDLDADRPVIQFTNGLSLGTSMAAGSRKNLSDRNLNGNVTDNEGISKLEYKSDLISGMYYAEAPEDWATENVVNYYTANDCATRGPATFVAGTYYKKTPGTYQNVTLTGSSFSISLSDGAQNISFRVTSNGKTFETSETESLNLNSPKIRDGAATPATYGYSDSTKKATSLFVIVDTQKPNVSSIEYSLTPDVAASWSNASRTFGGNDANSFYIRQFAYDVNGIAAGKTDQAIKQDTYGTRLKIEKNAKDVSTGDKRVTGFTASDEKYYYYALNEVVGSTRSLVGNTGTEWRSIEIKTLGMETGNRNAIFEVYDGTSSKETEFILVIDNTAPVITVSQPDSSQYSSGNIVAYGETDLTDWRNASETDQPKEFMYYALTLDNTTTPAEDYEHRANANASTSWTDENGVSPTTNPAGGTKTISYKPYYTPIIGGSFNWYVYFDGGSTGTNTHAPTFKNFLIDAGITTQSAIENTNPANKFTTVVKAYLWIKAVDEVGNTTIEKHPVLIDPQGDAPSVTIDYPEEDGAILGGSVTLRGTATDIIGTNVGVDSVWVQIISAKENGYDSGAVTSTPEKTCGGLVFTDTVTSTTEKHTYTLKSFIPTSTDVNQWISKGYEVYTNITNDTPTPITESIETTNDASAYYIRASFAGSAWNLKINNNGEYDPENGKLNPIAYRVFAKDRDGYLSRYQQQLSVYDSDNPIVSGVYLRQYDDAGNVIASRPYEDNMWVKGTWWLYGTVKDTNGIASIKIKPKGGTETTCTVSGDENADEHFNYKLSTENGVGSLSIEVTATDKVEQGAKPHETVKTYDINYDNTDPIPVTSGANYKISDTLQNSQGFYSFSSQVTENNVGNNAQSGFDYLAFWFERNITDKRVVYDVMRSKQKDANNNPLSEVQYNSLEQDSGLMWKSEEVTRSATALGTLTLANSANPNIHVGGLCKLGGSIYFVTGVNGQTITIDGQPEKSKDETETTDETTKITTYSGNALFAIANVVNNNVESGSGSRSTTDGMYGYFESISNDDGDHMLESVSKQGTTWTWEANINSQNIPDGSITLHYVVFDKAGNFARGEVSGRVANNAPRLASLEVWSDFNENNTKDTGEYITKYWKGMERKIGVHDTRATGLTSELLVSNNDLDVGSGSAFMTVKAKTRFTPELVGGNNELYYSYKYKKDNSTDWSEESYDDTTIGNGHDDGIDELVDREGYYKEDDNKAAYIEGHTDVFMEIPSSIANAGNSNSATDPTWFEYTIYDSTEGCQLWTSPATGKSRTDGRLSAKFRVALNLQYVDSTPPVTVISPLYWKSSSDNSVYKNINGESLGHVELKSDLGTSTLGSTYGKDDDKISGTVVFRGFAYDNKKLTELKWGLVANNDGNNYTKPTYKFGSGMQSGATFNGTTWNSTATMAANHYTFEVSKAATDGAYHNQNGHKVAWTLTLDTSYIDGVVGTDLRVIVQATDSQASAAATRLSTITNASATSTADPETDPATYDAGTYCPTYQVDVLPYIKGVKTWLAKKNKRNPEVYSRTAQGHYPIASDETEVILQGFNLAAGNADVNISSTIESSTTGAYAYTIPDTTITTINNMNNNNAHGAFDIANASYSEETKVLNMYNRTPSTVTNLTLNDDVYFDIWEFKKAAAPKSGKINEPVMRINPYNNMIGFAFANGADSLSLPSARDNNFTSYTNWQYNYADYAGINFVYDTAGTVHSISTGLDTEPKSGLAGYMQYINSGWGGNGNNMNNWNAERTLALESVGIPSGVYVGGKALTANLIDVDRFGKPTIAVAGTSRVYVAYYDGDNDQIRFRYGDNITTSRRNGGRSSGYEQFSDDKTAGGTIGHDTAGNGYNSHTMFEAHTDYYSLLAGKTQGATQTDTGNGTSEFVALDVIAGNSAANDIVVIVWYDGSDLMYTYRYGTKDDDTDCKSTGVANKWSEPKVIFEGAGQYCTIKVDKNNGIHIAAYNRSGADLYYAYMPAYNQYSKLKTALVDSYSQVGKYISLDTALVLREGTTDKYNVVPYITYYGDGFNGLPKLAYLPGGINKDDVVVPNGADDDTDLFTGEWEVSLIPTSSEVNEDNMNVALWKTNAGVLTNSTKPATGYTEPKIKAAGTNSATWYGNGSSELVLGYGITDGATGFIEIGQMKNPEQ